ncbi:MAG: DUF1735 domain-containing protein [Chloroflexia bacterium]|nr:DUF1735 domain-containing protein [Chloroflexia bacterium]
MKRNIYKLILSALFVSVGLTSCLKDDDIDDQKYGLINLNANKIIEIPADASHEISLTLLPEGTKELTIGEVRLAAESPASEDITVSLTSANTSDIIGSDKPLFPLDGVTVPATVTIPKGSRSVPLVVSINTTLLQSDPQYIAISITSVDKQGYIVSGNFGHLKLNMKVKHKFEGRYILTGSMVDVLNANLKHVTTAYSGEYTVQLRTKDGSTLAFYDELIWEDFMYPIANGASLSGYGSFGPEFTFDENGNIIAVSNHFGVPANTRVAQLDPSGVNKYDPATKSFTVSYWMNQPSLVPAPPNHRSSITETYTFKEDL